MNLIQYEELVNDLSQRADGSVCFNSGPEHAKIVIRKLFDRSKTGIDIFSGKLSTCVFDIGMFEVIANRLGVQNIRVIVSDGGAAAKEGSLVKEVISLGVDVRVFPEIGSHVIVSDNNSYRLEHDLDGMKAIFAFGTEKAVEFSNIFKKMWEASSNMSDLQPV